MNTETNAKKTVATVWCPDWGQSDEDDKVTQVTVEDRLNVAMQIEDAAEMFAAESFDSGDPFNEIEVCVKINGETYFVQVDVEAVPEFHAGLVRKA
jgi:hypothetical protein